MHWIDGFGGGWMMVFWWALIIVAIIALVRWGITLSPQSTSNRQNNRDALDILKERYARGEIDKEEFEEKKKDLLS
jgi:putative membrane protein